MDHFMTAQEMGALTLEYRHSVVVMSFYRHINVRGFKL